MLNLLHSVQHCANKTHSPLRSVLRITNKLQISWIVASATNGWPGLRDLGSHRDFIARTHVLEQTSDPTLCSIRNTSLLARQDAPNQMYWCKRVPQRIW